MSYRSGISLSDRPQFKLNLVGGEERRDKGSFLVRSVNIFEIVFFGKFYLKILF